MADSQIVFDMTEAVALRQHPAITRWNRLEGRPRTHDFDRALRAELRDALWMLARQWQMGEFQGDDAGSPILALACIDASTIHRFQAGQEQAEPLDSAEPLEARVERRPLPLRAEGQYLSLDLRLLVGRRWLKLLDREFTSGGLSTDYGDAYTARYPVPVPDPTRKTDAAVCAHLDVWQMSSAAAGRAMDGIALLEHLADSSHHAYDGVGADPADEPKLTALAEKLHGWLTSLIVQPSAGNDNVWLSERLEYQFAVSAQDLTSIPFRSRELVMRAEEYYQGHLDWYVLERRPDEAQLSGPPLRPAKLERYIHTFLPASIVFEGMPNTRWWAFEDRRTNFGEVRPDTTDLGKLLLMEFGLVYANDWFVLPYTLAIGQVAEVRGIAISSVFNERFWIEPSRERSAQDWEKWAMFTLSASVAEQQAPPTRLVLLPSSQKVQESAPVEEIALIRDEVANMVWAIENRIPLPSGKSKPGGEAAREYRQYLQHLIGKSTAGPETAVPIRYQVMNGVPEQWIPFIPVHVAGSTHETQLQRAAMPRIIENDPNPPEKVRPRTTLLRQNFPQAYFIQEQEVPRAGLVVRQSYQRTRWAGGKVFTWLGVRKLTGRGEGMSGLQFDGLINARER
jgi:hypothetical protein